MIESTRNDNSVSSERHAIAAITSRDPLCRYMCGISIRVVYHHNP